MVGIVIVSHSATLAVGVKELIAQMAQHVPFALAGGTENPDEPIGTDPIRVLQAIEAVYSPDGVLVLMDLGSAIMSAEAAIELLSPEQQEQVYLCEAPLVEGALAAAVAAAGGAPIERVWQEARQAQAAKHAQLAPILRLPSASVAPTPSAPLSPHVSIGAVELTQTFVIANPLGLHARPAARLVNIAGAYDALITLSKGTQTVTAASINQLLTLGARQGDEVTVHTQGPEAAAAMAAMAALIANNFGDRPAVAGAQTAPTPVAETAVGQLQGIPIAAGIAIGPVVALTQRASVVGRRTVADVTAERARLTEALATVVHTLDELEHDLSMRAATTAPTAVAQTVDAAAILAAQRLMLLDPHLTTQVYQRLATEQCNAEWAWHTVIAETAAQYEMVDDAYLRQRVVDLRDVGERVLRVLGGQPATPQPLTAPGIVVAEALTPSTAATLDPTVVLGLVTVQGGANDHSAILARTLGIPTVMGVTALTQLPLGREIALDGAAGLVWLDPDAATVKALTAQRATWLAERAALQSAAQLPAVMSDGVTIGVMANIGAPQEVPLALVQGAAGIGLLRTELLFLSQPTLPDEETQVQLYRQIVAALGDRPLTVRTLDIGGDKPLPFLPLPPEANPFLGWRGLRYCLDNPTVFRPQVRALLRVAAELGDSHRLKIMLPMVSTVEEFLAAKALFVAESAQLALNGQAPAPLPPLGVMIETPAAVFNASQLAQQADFFSIGTNDLTQYVMAADRGNAQVAALVNPFQPPVLQAIAHAAHAAHTAGIPVSICGEMAADPRATALLIGLGVTELSMNPQAIPAVKVQIRQLQQAHANAMAHHALTLTTVAAVEAYLVAEE